ncbi:hypothetical protein Pmani_015975 [Petrolisthes manimaculis]|uniref:Uncharacterized protein n=1 Tax=Petrolisthes manimaculis TaxID=1843537 RepID=A0AAE1UBI0_9EUCA|nr:hypothetical protein Pmani_015975 [Petrolisthes manimaculis]
MVHHHHHHTCPIICVPGPPPPPPYLSNHLCSRSTTTTTTPVQSSVFQVEYILWSMTVMKIMSGSSSYAICSCSNILFTILLAFSNYRLFTNLSTSFALLSHTLQNQ